jgi:formate dehydrogenase subunit gamma
MTEIQTLIAAHAATPGGLMPLLHAVQDAHGYIPAEAVPAIAKGMNLSRAEVHGVITYYSHFHTQPLGKQVIQVCVAEACKACGGDELMKHAEQTLGCAVGDANHGTSANGAYTLHPVYCLGLCAQSPAIQIGDDVHARMNAVKFDALLKKAA